MLESGSEKPREVQTLHICPHLWIPKGCWLVLGSLEVRIMDTCIRPTHLDVCMKCVHFLWSQLFFNKVKKQEKMSQL